MRIFYFGSSRDAPLRVSMRYEHHPDGEPLTDNDQYEHKIENDSQL